MILSEIVPGSNIELEVTRNGEKQNINVEVNQLHDKALLLQAICYDGKVLGFSDAENVDLLYISDCKVHMWKGIKISPVKYNGHIYHAVESPLDSEIVNRRGAYRVYMGREMYITTFTSTGPQSVEVLVKDISETGFAFISKTHYQINDFIRLQLEIDAKSAIRLTSKVVRMEDRGGSDFLYGCRFADKNRILSAYLMKFQAEKQKNKLGNGPRTNQEESSSSLGHEYADLVQTGIRDLSSLKNPKNKG